MQKPNQQKTKQNKKTLKLYLLFLLLFLKSNSEVWGQMDPSPRICELKGKIHFLVGLQEPKLELPRSVVFTAPA